MSVFLLRYIFYKRFTSVKTAHKGNHIFGPLLIDFSLLNPFLLSLSALSLSLAFSLSLVTDGLAHLSEDSVIWTCLCLTGRQRSNDIVEGEEPFLSPASLCDTWQKRPVAAWLTRESNCLLTSFVYKTIALNAGRVKVTAKILSTSVHRHLNHLLLLLGENGDNCKISFYICLYL